MFAESNLEFLPSLSLIAGDGGGSLIGLASALRNWLACLFARADRLGTKLILLA
jgi:hypothetical protein